MTNADTPTADILIVEDDPGHAEAMQEGLARVGHRCTLTDSGEAAIAHIAGDSYDVIVTDLMLGPGPDGLAVQAAANEHLPATRLIVVTANPSVETCRIALQEGAFDYIEKPLDLDELRAVVSRAAQVTAQRRTVKEVREQLDEQYGFEEIIARSPQMLEILDTVRRIAPSDLPVLILGRSGTGKDLLANAIHKASRRKDQRLVAINCAGLSESLLEDELFGHVKGAFTGATADRPGRFEHASGGTLFLDEIGDMPMAMQAKLLRVLENGEVVRVGANEPIRVNVRIISATNSNIAQRVANKQFREDLYFRIKGTTIEIPPLTHRREDIPLLIDHFIKLANERQNRKVKSVAPDARRALMAYPWPGNIRQLENAIERVVLLNDGPFISVEDLHFLESESSGGPVPEYRDKKFHGSEKLGIIPEEGIDLDELIMQLVGEAMVMANGNKALAAKLLNISPRTITRRLEKSMKKE
ncbi:MAG: sigma-54-dependent Fis family transcriptional regulator [Phycisphaerae bacterium]|nr:sigma-54-dependent Fis family transcriptional regulator [Phycisphaerae bacterium]